MLRLLIPLETAPRRRASSRPASSSFDLPPLFDGVPAWLDKYMLQAIVAVIIIVVFWLSWPARTSMVPSKGQFIGETAYFFVRNSHRPRHHRPRLQASTCRS